MDRSRNVSIFEDTQRLCETDRDLRAAVARSREKTVLVREGDALACHAGEKRFGAPMRVVVSKKRSFEAAAGYPSERVCVMNFASASNPGGVTRGANAQEECLCRCSTLYPCLDNKPMWEGFYQPHRRLGDPLHNDDCIYTPDVVVFKSDTASPELLPEEERYRVDVLTCAAPNLRERPSNPMNPGDGSGGVSISRERLRALHEKRMRCVLDLACEQGAEVLILGAFGCGAFQNPPQVVAAAMRDALRDYKQCFKTVELAVYCAPGREENYRAFASAFTGWR